jgi:NADPH:quinone reductase
MRAIRITEFGGPEVLTLVDDQPEPTPRQGELLLDVSHAGINYADTHQAEDSYLAPSTLPLVPGAEVAGTTQDGRRVVALLAGGGYAERAVAAAPLAFDVPNEVSDGQALALVLQGTTAWHLLRTSAHLQPGESVVVHAAAGGVGTLAVQLAKRWGAGKVIAVASSDEKRQLALDLGADEAVDAGAPELKAALVGANRGTVDVVLDMVGGRTTDQSRPGAVRPARALRDGVADPAVADPAGRPDGSLPGCDRLLAGARDARSGAPPRRADARAAGDDGSGRAASGRRWDVRAVGGATGTRGPAWPAHGRQAAARPVALRPGAASRDRRPSCSHRT